MRLRKLVCGLVEEVKEIKELLRVDLAKDRMIERLEEQNRDLMARFMARSYEEFRVYEPNPVDDGDLPGDMASLLDEPEPGSIIDGEPTE